MDIMPFKTIAVICCFTAVFGCVSVKPVTSEAITVNSISPSIHIPYTVSVDAHSSVNNEPARYYLSGKTLKAAIETSIDNVQLFTTTSDINSDLILLADIKTIDLPDAGTDILVLVKINWKLVNRHTNNTILDEDIRSAGTASFDESFWGDERFRLSIGRATKKNIEKILQRVSSLDMN